MGHDFRGPTIREKSWIPLPRTITSFSADAVFLGGVLDFVGPGTLLRFRCNDILLTFDATQQVDDDINITLGLGIVSTDAAAIGASAMPNPVEQIDYPWVWWGNYTLRSQLAAGVNALGSSVVRFAADSKAMRRVKPSQSLVWVIQSSGASGGPATVVDIGVTRVLIGN